MQNLDVFPDEKIVFKYDLKFSEVNRKHLDNIQDVYFIQEYLVNQDRTMLELFKLKDDD